MASAKTKTNIPASIATVTHDKATAERDALAETFAEARTAEADALALVEQSTEAYEHLETRLRSGDLEVSADDLMSARLEIDRAEVIHKGAASRANVAERQLSRKAVPTLAILVAETLSRDDLLSRIEWAAIERRGGGGNLEGTEHRVGLVYQSENVTIRDSVASGVVVLSVHHDPLTKKLDQWDIRTALQRDGRITVTGVESSASTDRHQTHRVGVGHAVVEAVPTLSKMPSETSYGGPRNLRAVPALGARVESQKLPNGAWVPVTSTSTPQRVDNDVWEVTGKCRVTANVEMENQSDIDPLTGALVAAIVAEGNPERPAYGSLGVCVKSEVTEVAPLGRNGRLISVSQTYHFRTKG
ncbi:hypothetical protein ACI3ET_06695 [Ornithinimicrobium sp. LYQ121]|uniref:hypothetical protein n=1 Tax=Ornithinimicrobium sp. LYQ121 TaxID=3378801 RepID=UPI0038518D6F